MHIFNSILGISILYYRLYWYRYFEKIIMRILPTRVNTVFLFSFFFFLCVWYVMSETRGMRADNLQTKVVHKGHAFVKAVSGWGGATSAFLMFLKPTFGGTCYCSKRRQNKGRRWKVQDIPSLLLYIITEFNDTDLNNGNDIIRIILLLQRCLTNFLQMKFSALEYEWGKNIRRGRKKSIFRIEPKCIRFDNQAEK